jgi:hypothetical protein
VPFSTHASYSTSKEHCGLALTVTASPSRHQNEHDTINHYLVLRYLDTSLLLVLFLEEETTSGLAFTSLLPSSKPTKRTSSHYLVPLSGIQWWVGGRRTKIPVRLYCSKYRYVGQSRPFLSFVSTSFNLWPVL